MKLLKKKGVLKKKGKFSHRRRNSEFWLDKRSLSYTGLKGVTKTIPLQESTLTDSKTGSTDFQIHVNGRTYELEADNLEEKNAWIQAIETAQEIYKMSGQVYKRGNVNTAWKKRFMVMKGGRLVYYKTPSQQTQKGRIELHQSKFKIRVPDNDFEFQIETEDRTYYLRTETRDERDKWVGVLVAAEERDVAAVPDDVDPILMIKQSIECLKQEEKELQKGKSTVLLRNLRKNISEA
jgi:hypothetical protein